MPDGKFIIIEGTDCSGKETQKKKLVERLHGLNIPVEGLSFPRYGTPTGDIVGACYLGKPLRSQVGSWFGEADSVDPKVASLYYATDRRAAAPEVKQKLNSGINLVCDRYVESNMGHQGGKIKNPQQRAKFFEWLESLEYGLLELPRPDLIIFLYMPLKVANALKGNRGGVLDGHESNEFHLTNAEKSYLELAERYGWRTILCAPDKTPKTLKTPEKIHEEVWANVKDLFR